MTPDLRALLAQVEAAKAHPLAKLYDLAMGIVLGASATLLIQGDNDKALGLAIIALGLRLTIGRRALNPTQQKGE